MSEPSIAVKNLLDHFSDNYDDESLTLRKNIYRETYLEFADQSTYYKQAQAYARFLAQKPVCVHPYDLLAGQIQHHNFTGSMPAKFADDFDPREHPVPREPSVDDARIEWEACAPYLADVPQEDRDAAYSLVSGVAGGLYTHTSIGHVITGFRKVAHTGWNGLLEEIESSLADSGKNAEQRDYLCAMKTVLTAAQNYILRYARAAGDTIKDAQSETQAQNLARIADACRQLAQGPASSFFEAVQSTVLLQELVTMEILSGSMSLGRMDQLFGPYYEADLAAGRITAEEAQELIHAWRIKLAGLVNGYQNVAIGGCDRDGNFFANDITRMILRSTHDVRLDQPLLSMRYSRKMDDALWEETLRVIETGNGFPALFSDGAIIKSRVDAGVPADDAWDYGLVGCVEPCIQGREYSNTEQMRLNWPLVLELMLHGGKTLRTGEAFPLANIRNLDEIQTFGEFLSWFKSELAFHIQRGAHAVNVIDTVYHKAFPSILLSATLDDCIMRGQDAGAGGAKYRFSTFSNTGMANAVDSLLAIKQMVFENGMVTLPELACILARDFKGQEKLRLYAANRCPKFGNGDPGADGLMQELVDFASGIITNIKNTRGFHFLPSYYSVYHHASMGWMTGATADGRHAGVSLANALSPVQGADSKGPTAVIGAVTRCDHTKFGNGMVLDLKFSPSFFHNPVHRANFRSMIDTYFDQGGMEIQMNVIDRETLTAAQKEPEKYKNLIVRVSGFSAYFVTLNRTLQDEIIARTQYDGMG